MYSYKDLIQKLNIEDTPTSRLHLKTIINALIKKDEAFVEKQKIYVDINKVMYLWDLLDVLSAFFDYKYNTKRDLTQFLSYILDDERLNINAIFCPGYTDNGYKNYIGRNNTSRLETLKRLKNEFGNMGIYPSFKITFADIFLENIDVSKNPQLYMELDEHRSKFIEKTLENFELEDIVVLSSIFKGDNYREGFIDTSILHGTTYRNFFKNNRTFYNKMGWTEEQAKERNDKLFTIYSIISEYINRQRNGVYIPMETMYSRSKVMTRNDVCTMYLHK